MIDTSALLAVLLKEDDGERLQRAIAMDRTRIMSAVSALEASIVIASRFGDVGVADLDRFLQVTGIAVQPFDAAQVAAARTAYRRFGKGNHPAVLNMGDCCTYALARITGEPVLFKGNDFGQTDLSVVPV